VSSTNGDGVLLLAEFNYRYVTAGKR